VRVTDSPQAYLRDVLTVARHPMDRIDELLFAHLPAADRAAA